LFPQDLLIGNTGLGAFAAETEAKIDAGACMSLEAWAQGVAKDAPFQGLAVNLCDVDGTQQYLELVTYHPATKPIRGKLYHQQSGLGACGIHSANASEDCSGSYESCQLSILIQA